jgi:hypothetical protein
MDMLLCYLFNEVVGTVSKKTKKNTPTRGNSPRKIPVGLAAVLGFSWFIRLFIRSFILKLPFIILLLAFNAKTGQ